ncbi:HEPN domain-containing protein [Candidatus Poribacteria bacterium]|nr:HEPN domain-containing protein [Candidatus Poribacteria bacterium]MBT5710305.1 HEPN domain-containing protein [Candidatus Poribacteria bacterium]MBT7100329.1 HEPN domain-containing protein [Candidatus Poribacteria bacterium]MBT7809527.1 HEPN domain-containing protein [Candidatus Poribacteria bacterium]
MTRELAAEEWLVVAEQELARARRFLDHDDTFAAYCLENAVETFLRAHYATLEIAAPDDVDLGALARRVVSPEPPASIEACEDIARHSAAARSGVGPGPQLEDIRASLATIEPMLADIREGIRSSDREET